MGIFDGIKKKIDKDFEHKKKVEAIKKKAYQDEQLALAEKLGKEMAEHWANTPKPDRSERIKQRLDKIAGVAKKGAGALSKLDDDRPRQREKRSGPFDLPWENPQQQRRPKRKKPKKKRTKYIKVEY